jgi:hypothetical protein
VIGDAPDEPRLRREEARVSRRGSELRQYSINEIERRRPDASDKTERARLDPSPSDQTEREKTRPESFSLQAWPKAATA